MVKDRYHEFLRQVPMFASLDHSELDAVARAVTDLEFDAGHVLMREGGSAHELVIVVDGQLEVTRDGEHIADIGPGGFAGEIALFTHSQRHATVATKTHVSLLHIDGRTFSALMDDVPRIAVKMLPIIAARVSYADDHSA